MSTVKIICYSPTAGGKKLSKKIAAHFQAEIHDITRAKAREAFDCAAALKSARVLFFVCPVYAHTVPREVKKFLKRVSFSGYAVPCVVFGGVCGGRALAVLAARLKKCGASIIGGIQASVPHSYLSLSGGAAAHGDMDAALTEYFPIIENRVKIGESIGSKAIPKKINPLAYIAPRLRKRLSVALPAVNRARCNGCGQCVSACPVDAVTDELHIKKSKCTRCLACVKYCPQNARKLYLSKPLLWYLKKYSTDKGITTY
ncbi:MAG: EFR1 family ferrodoxin [Firmicutes bacterium]|nr:EFR1 family ferrodoxin [Bacillota bacterium]